MELVFAYGAGLLTLINPCVLPILPIVLASALNADRRGPLALAAGMGVTFVALGVGVTAFGAALGLDEELVVQAAAVMMILFGVILLTPRLGEAFASATAGVASRADMQLNEVETPDLRGQFVTGALLGAVWSPCIGPTLGGAIGIASAAAASDGLALADLLWAAAIMTAFALGVATLIIGLSLGAREAIRARANKLRGLAERSKPILGATLLTVGVVMLFGLYRPIEAWLVQNLPSWLVDLSVSL
ncbi:MAG: cytochrome c biogenesis protein CcdA [Neomegalonema sp.]|nr:cytochrome c biogenesis protein CcdA [Neomegalonema sp.]